MAGCQNESSLNSNRFKERGIEGGHIIAVAHRRGEQISRVLNFIQILSALTSGKGRIFRVGELGRAECFKRVAASRICGCPSPSGGRAARADGQSASPLGHGGVIKAPMALGVDQSMVFLAWTGKVTLRRSVLSAPSKP